MGSLAAKAVAEEVLENVGKGLKPNITKIAIKRGYSPKTANAGRVQTTKTYKAAVGTFIEKLEIERQRAIDTLSKRIGKAKYRDLNDAIDKLTKTHQLLTGGATEHIAVKPIYGGRSVETLPKHDGDGKNLPTQKED